MECSRGLCCASPFKEKFIQTNTTHAAAITILNESELASRWKISVRSSKTVVGAKPELVSTSSKAGLFGVRGKQ
jgi:hypothetical protein